MEIPKTSSERIEGIELRERLAKLLLDLRPEGNKRKFKNDVQFEEHADDGRSWLGLHGSDPEKNLYVGFKLRDKNGKADFAMVIEMDFPEMNPQRELELTGLNGRLNGEIDKVWTFEQPISGDPKFDGNIHGIREWFEQKLCAISKV